MNETEKFSETSQKVSLISAIALSATAFGVFLYYSHFIESSLLMLIIALFIIVPFRKRSEFASRFTIILGLMFVVGLLNILGTSLVPFFIAFILAYILDPLISGLERKRIPRWVSSLFIILVIVGMVTTVAVFVFPLVFEQLDGVLKSISTYVSSARNYVESEDFYTQVEALGLPKDAIRGAIREQLLPRVEDIASVIFGSLLSVLNSLSSVLTQLVNAILIPILAFYLLKDFSYLKQYISKLLAGKNDRLLKDLKRINVILRKYIGWQMLAAIIVGTFTSISYTIFGIPYPIVLGVLAGLFNPLPYLGTVLSILIGTLTILLVNEPGIWSQILTIILTINGLHFINAYILEPNIIGKQVGLHPVLLLISLFVFSGIFGLIGLLIAVPTTAALMMFFNDWRTKSVIGTEE